MRLCKAEITLTQPDDDLGTGIDDQYLMVKVEDAGAGPYLVLETARWAVDFDDIAAFVEQLKRIQNTYTTL
jgi:hypothetical protein